MAEELAAASGGDIAAALKKQGDEAEKLFRSIPEGKAQYAYEPGKWTIAQVIGHLADTERIITYRLLSIARGETKSLPGFEQDDYVANGGFHDVPLRTLVDTYAAVRNSTLALFRTIPDAAWERQGKANDNPVTARALAYICAGHLESHLRSLRAKYLN